MKDGETLGNERLENKKSPDFCLLLGLNIQWHYCILSFELPASNKGQSFRF